MTVRRNPFGRQVDSFDSDLSIAGLDGGPYRGVFIRAPLPTGGRGRRGPRRRAAHRQDRRGPLGTALATAFHPELTGDRRIHELFVNIVRQES